MLTLSTRTLSTLAYEPRRGEPADPTRPTWSPTCWRPVAHGTGAAAGDRRETGGPSRSLRSGGSADRRRWGRNAATSASQPIVQSGQQLDVVAGGEERTLHQRASRMPRRAGERQRCASVTADGADARHVAVGQRDVIGEKR